MKSCALFFASVLLSILTKDGRGRRLYKSEGIHYIVRIINLTDTDSTGQPYLQNVKWTFHEMQQYVSATAINRKTYFMHTVKFHFDRCRDLEFSCEDFISWNITGICPYLRMKNQLWSRPVASFSPKPFKICPQLDQGVYEMKNASLDVDTLIAYYNEAPKYYWKAQAYFYNERHELQSQWHIHAYFTAYTKRSNNSMSNL